jgi:hypothetical protein
VGLADSDRSEQQGAVAGDTRSPSRAILWHGRHRDLPRCSCTATVNLATECDEGLASGRAGSADLLGYLVREASASTPPRTR